MIATLRGVRRAHVLDAGCGSGSLAIRLARVGLTVEAIDLSPDFVTMVRRKVHEAGVSEQVIVRQMDVTRLEFPDRSFDIVTSGEVLEHVADDKKAIDEFARVLKPGGLCIATVPANPKLWSICDEWAGHKRRYSKEGLKALFCSKGFDTISISHWGFPMIWIYDRLLFRRYALRMMEKASEEQREHTLTKLGTNPIVCRVLASTFLVDRLFSWYDWGPGLLLRARRTEQ